MTERASGSVAFLFLVLLFAIATQYRHPSHITPPEQPPEELRPC
ncbi:hypothetical protein ACSYAD_30845 [Acaryochloris marina NIES-2412]